MTDTARTQATGKTTLDLAVVDVALCCATGNQPFSLLGAAGTGMVLARPDPQMNVPGRDGELFQPLICPVAEDDWIASQRMHVLLQRALAGAFPPGRETDRPPAVFLLIPSRDNPSRGAVAGAEWQAAISAFPFVPAGTSVEVREHTQCLATHLVEAWQWFEEQEAETLLFGAVDSRLDLRELQTLALEGLLTGDGHAAGLVSGEAALFLALRPAAAADGEVLGRIREVVGKPEPEHGRADETILRGLADAFETLRASAQGNVIESPVIVPLAGHAYRQLEWQQVTNRLWPVRLDEERRQAMQAGEIESPQPVAPETPELLDPGTTLGSTGIVETLLGLVLGIARLEFDWPACDQVYVADMPDAHWRGVIRLETGTRQNA